MNSIRRPSTFNPFSSQAPDNSAPPQGIRARRTESFRSHATLLVVFASWIPSMLILGCSDSDGRPSGSSPSRPSSFGTIDDPLLLAAGSTPEARSALVLDDQTAILSRGAGQGAIDYVSVDPLTPNPATIRTLVAHNRNLTTPASDGEYLVWGQRTDGARYETFVARQADLGPTPPTPTPWSMSDYPLGGAFPNNAQVADGWIARPAFLPETDPNSTFPIHLLLANLDTNFGANPRELSLDETPGTLVFNLEEDLLIWSSRRNDRVVLLEPPFPRATPESLPSCAGPDAGNGLFGRGFVVEVDDVIWTAECGVDTTNRRSELVHLDRSQPIVPEENPRVITEDLLNVVDPRTRELLAGNRLTWLNSDYQVRTQDLRDPDAEVLSLTDSPRHCHLDLRAVGSHLLWIRRDVTTLPNGNEDCLGSEENVTWTLEFVDEREFEEAQPMAIFLQRLGARGKPLFVLTSEVGIAWVDQVAPGPVPPGGGPAPDRFVTRFFNPDAPVVFGTNPYDLLRRDDTPAQPLIFTDDGLIVSTPPESPDTSSLDLFDTVALRRATNP